MTDVTKAPLTADKIPVHCAFDKLVPITELRENPNNPNQHPTVQLKLLAKIILKTGWRKPITVSNRSGLITTGHGRLYAAQLEKFTEAPVDFQDYDDEVAELEDVLADNRIAELAEMDVTKLGDQIRFLEAEGADLEVAGFDTSTVEELLGAAPMTEDDFLGDEFELPDGDIQERDILGKVTIFVAQSIRDEIMTKLRKLGEAYGDDQFRVVK